MTATITPARICEQCADPLVRRKRENSKQWGNRRYCSRACFNSALAARVGPGADYSNYVVATSGCWEWQGYVDRNGYGRIYDRAKARRKRTDWAHRAFYERFKGDIPARYEIDHTCENTICVNPAHLDAVTKVEHARRTFDRIGKNDRHKVAAEMRSGGLSYVEIAEVLGYADRNSAALAVKRAIDKGLVAADSIPKQPHLTRDEREDIRDLYALGVPQPELAAWYGTNNSHISRICNRLDSRAARVAAGLAQ